MVELDDSLKYDYELAERTKYENLLPEEEVHRMCGELLLGNARYIDPWEFMSKEEYLELGAKVLKNYKI